MNDLVSFGKALSDSTRIRILYSLRKGELCVCELMDALELNQSTLSSHLQIIRQAGLVTTRRSAKWVYYALEAEQAPLLETVFTHFQDSLAADKRVRRDAERLTQRLELRVNGCCVVSFVPLEILRERR